MSFFTRPAVDNTFRPIKWWEKESQEPIERKSETIIDGKAYPNISIGKTNLTSPAGE